MMTELRYGIVLKEGIKISDFMEQVQVACGNNAPSSPPPSGSRFLR